MPNRYSVVIQVVSDANGNRTPHDGNYIVAWNPHTKFGICEVTSTDDISKAHHFDNESQAHWHWTTTSNIQPVRPDGRPNRPLTGLTIALVRIP